MPKCDVASACSVKDPLKFRESRAKVEVAISRQCAIAISQLLLPHTTTVVVNSFFKVLRAEIFRFPLDWRVLE